MTLLQNEAPPRAPPLPAQAPPPPAAERLLLDAATRAARAPAGKFALALHLGRLAPPAPHPHHRRIAQALLLEAAQRHDGQLYPLANGDLVLLCRAPADRASAAACADSPTALSATLARLFAAEAPDPARIVSLWRLADEAEELLAYAAAELARPEQPPPSEPEPALRPILPLVKEFTALAAAPHLDDLLQRQTAALIEPGRQGQPHAFQPCFREISIAPAALRARHAGAGLASLDSDLARHFTARHDAELLATLHAALPGTGPLGWRAQPRSLALHLNLALASIFEPPFARLAGLCRAGGIIVGAEVALAEALAEPEVFARARAVLGRLGFRIVLDQVSHPALLLCRAEAFAPDLLKLDFSPRLSRLPGSEQNALAARLAAIGPERVILVRSDTEDALFWGLGQGIRRFQGRHVDRMLAAARMLTCREATLCTLHQCHERAGAVAPTGRHLCRNLPLLDGRSAPNAGAC